MSGDTRKRRPAASEAPSGGALEGGDDYAGWKRWREEDFGRFSRRDARYFGWLMKRCHAGTLHAVLEVGFGNGSFLGYCHHRGLTVSGLEQLPELCERAQRQGWAAHARLEDLEAAQRFDLIAAFDVLEHLPQAELPAWISALRDRLTPGGTLLLRVPNGESPFGRQNQHGDLTHQTTLGLSKFRQLAARCGMEVAWHGEVPRHVTTRGLKNLARAAVRRTIELTLAFAHDWDASNLGENLVVALRVPHKPRA